ncbi:transcriptional regulator [Grimontia sp. AD028]|uniref:LysR family transcriptional regulator n=1 Tax=Grimontia sp. AD028 TaxID=1581149 RepID=UPI00061AE1E6|nr:LysR family transcriptional regulator [Grimontia sp. AD028]KKD59684.1 transcriptional regulator [Grimontia sp. AD028]
MRSVRFPQLPPLDALVAFEAAAEHESFARAGEELFLTASAVAYQVKKLESHLAVSLFARHGKGVSLTPKGKEFLVLVKQALKGFEENVERIRHGKLRPVRLATQHAIAQFWLQKRLGNYQHDFPEHELEITAVSTVSGQPEETDLALGYFLHDPGRRWQKLWSETLLPVSAPNYVGKDDPVFYQDMHWHDDWRFWQDKFSGIQARTRRSSLYALLLQSVLDGQGAMVGRVSLLQDYLERGELVPWPDDSVNQAESGGYYLYRSVACDDHPVANHFYEWLTAQCASR